MSNPIELLRREAARLPHAIVRDRIIDDKGRVEAEREFHYLTCRRCELERRANALEAWASSK